VRGRAREGDLLHNQRCVPRQSRQQPRHVTWAQRDASGGGRKIVLRDMKKDCAATPKDAGADIVIEHADNVVEPVCTAHFLMAPARNAPQRTIVKKGPRIVAPDVVRPYDATRKADAGQRDRALPQEQIKHRESPGRRGAVPLAFIVRDAAAAESAAQNEVSREQPPLMREPAGDARDVKA
jgi:hypothetical protein